MKNYNYNFEIREYFNEVPEIEWTSRMYEQKEYIDVLSDVVVMANCGWDKVEYKVMSYKAHPTAIREYMVLCVGGRTERWIPIDGNSRGCNFSVLGENLW